MGDGGIHIEPESDMSDDTGDSELEGGPTTGSVLRLAGCDLEQVGELAFHLSPSMMGGSKSVHLYWTSWPHIVQTSLWLGNA